jgi:hypothetical protein
MATRLFHCGNMVALLSRLRGGGSRCYHIALSPRAVSAAGLLFADAARCVCSRA